MNISQAIGRTNARHNMARHELLDAICRVHLKDNTSVDYIEVSPQFGAYLQQYARSCGVVTAFGMHTFMGCAMTTVTTLGDKSYLVITVDTDKKNPFITWALSNLNSECDHDARHILMNLNGILHHLALRKQYAVCVTCGQPFIVRQYDCDTERQMREHCHCFTCNFWTNRIKHIGRPNVYIFGGDYYTDAGNNENENKQFLGHGGAKFKITPFGKEPFVTNNLWHSGTIPSYFAIQDNCVMEYV